MVETLEAMQQHKERDDFDDDFYDDDDEDYESDYQSR